MKGCRSLLVESKHQSFQHRCKIKPFLHDRDASYMYMYCEGMVEAKPVDFNVQFIFNWFLLSVCDCPSLFYQDGVNYISDISLQEGNGLFIL